MPRRLWQEETRNEHRTDQHATFVVERTYPADAARIFTAFSDPDVKRRWFVEGEYTEQGQYFDGGDQALQREIGCGELYDALGQELASAH